MLIQKSNKSEMGKKLIITDFVAFKDSIQSDLPVPVAARSKA